MSRIREVFQDLKAYDRKAFIVYLTAGFPDIRTTEKLVIACEKKGADIVEIGVPFSDPMADGPVIQASSAAALKRGITLSKILTLVRGLRKKVSIPLVLMTYYNPVLAYGPVKFAKQAASAGVDGVIVPDLPPEEAVELKGACERYGIDFICLVAPTSSAARIKMVAAYSSGFLYYVSRTGVTGKKNALEQNIRYSIQKVKRQTSLPVAVGFGVSDPQQVSRLASMDADGIIVGSAVIDIIKKNIKNPVPATGRFIERMAQSAHKIR